MEDKPSVEYVYQTTIWDSTRWAGFEPRDGDVFVCTSYKAGTTWTQMICALLIHQTPDLPCPLAEMSPWLDMKLSSIEDVRATYEAQTHRRFIKTHTPLDALPYFEGVTYLVCGRDPRDVFMSMQNHMANFDPMRVGQLLLEQGATLEMPPPASEDINERFQLWMTQGSFEWEEDGFPFWSHFRHAASFWKHRKLPNIHFLHYADLKADLEGEMRRVAKILGIEVEEAKWPALVKAASFEAMKSNADRTAPDTDHGIWLSNERFFNKGVNAQWRGALSEDSLELYEEVKSGRYPQDFAEWLEEGTGAVGDPKSM